MSLRILGEKPYFWQWDSGLKLLVLSEDCNEVHFCNGTDDCALVVPIKNQENGDRVAEVPNILLQTTKPVRAYLYHRHDNGAETRTLYCFQVLERTKPADYVYTETEVLTWEDLDKRVTALENGGASSDDIEKAVKEYLDENPVDVDIPDTLPNPHKLTFTGAVTAEYDGSEAVEVKIPEGGSGGERRLIKEITLTEDTYTIDINSDSEGNPFELTELIVYGYTQGTASAGNFRINCYPNNDDRYSLVNISSFKGLDTTKRYWMAKCEYLGKPGKWMTGYSTPDSGAGAMQYLQRGCESRQYNQGIYNDPDIGLLTKLSHIRITSNTSGNNIATGSILRIYGR